MNNSDFDYAIGEDFALAIAIVEKRKDQLKAEYEALQSTCDHIILGFKARWKEWDAENDYHEHDTSTPVAQIRRVSQSQFRERAALNNSRGRYPMPTKNARRILNSAKRNRK